MEYICNVTFMVERSLSAKLYEWMKEEEAVRMGRLNEVVAVPGDPDFAAQALSVALQREFGTEAEALAYAETELPELFERFGERFGDLGMTFVSILKNVTLI